MIAEADRRLGLVSAWSIVALGSAYAAVLAAGLLTLDAPDQPIGGSLFVALELLILLMTPAMIGLMAAVHALTPEGRRASSLAALMFMTLSAGLTGIVHFVILTLGRQPPFAALPHAELLFAFRWPSLVYALDILAWDVFYSLAMLFAANALAKSVDASAIRTAMIASALLALAGLAGVATSDMQLRNLGIIGYLGLFVLVALLLARRFRRPAAERVDALAPGE